MEVGEEAQEATIRRRSGRSHSAAPFGYDADGWSGSTSQLPSRLQQPLGISNAPATQPPFRDRLLVSADNSLTEMHSSSFETEAAFQKLLADHPALLRLANGADGDLLLVT